MVRHIISLKILKYVTVKEKVCYSQTESTLQSNRKYVTVKQKTQGFSLSGYLYWISKGGSSRIKTLRNTHVLDMTQIYRLHGSGQTTLTARSLEFSGQTTLTTRSLRFSGQTINCLVEPGYYDEPGYYGKVKILCCRAGVL